jgi:molybdopterin synthase sulfur carrier subunit
VERRDSVRRLASVEGKAALVRTRLKPCPDGQRTAMIRVVLPMHLRTLAQVDGEVMLDVKGEATQRSVLDALEARYPVLCGTIRDHVTRKRRPFIRFFACGEDLSHQPPDAPLPEAVSTGTEPILIIGAIAGG